MPQRSRVVKTPVSTSSQARNEAPNTEARSGRSRTPLRNLFRREKSVSREDDAPVTLPTTAASIELDSDMNLILSSDEPVEENTGRSIFRKSRSKSRNKNNSHHQSSPSSVATKLDASAQYDGKESICDYDINPSLLYKLIEYRAWDEVIERTHQKPVEASIWVVRYDKKDGRTGSFANNPKESSVATADVSSIRWKMLPLHSAILFRAPLHVLKAVYSAYPAGVQSCDDRQMLPIHVACRIVVEETILQFLIDSYPSSLLKSDYKGRSPAEILLQDRVGKIHKKDSISRKELSDSEKLSKIVEKNMEAYEIKHGDTEVVYKEPKNSIDSHLNPTANATMEFDYDENPTILIRLIETKRWDDAIARCKNAPNEAAAWMCRYQDKNSEGDTSGKASLRWRILPIHSAVVLNAPVSVVRALIDAYPEGLRHGDDREMLPLHMAFRLGTDLDVCTLLVDSFPQSLHQKDKKGNTPMQILKAYRRKYRHEKKTQGVLQNPIDVKRKAIVNRYLGERLYRGDSVEGEMGPGDYNSKYDSPSEDSDTEFSASDYADSTCSSEESDTEVDGDKLFYDGMFSDIGRLTLQGIVQAPSIIFSCNSKKNVI